MAGPLGTKPGEGGGWSQTLRWEPLRCPNGPVRASLARPRPTIGSETRNGTDRAGHRPPDCLVSAQTLALDYLPGARLCSCPAPRLPSRVPSSGIQPRPAEVGFFIRQVAHPLTFMVTISPLQRRQKAQGAPSLTSALSACLHLTCTGGAESSSPQGHPRQRSFTAHFTDEERRT